MSDNRGNDRAHDLPEGGQGAERPANVPEPGATLAPGSLFARYSIVRCVGVGGMGAVFEATHTVLRKRVALKTLHANLAKSESARERFLREAETVARIQHPNVVDINDVGIENNIPYFVMEFLEGEDLSVWLERGALSLRDAVDIAVPIASGLATVHRLGIVHRDIKPENVFLARGMRSDIVTPKLVDFGVSKDLLASLRSGGPPLHTVTGTPHYMSPEQARGSAALDGRTDQYALGVLLYQCLAGIRPYDAPSLLELMHLIDAGEFRPLRSLAPHVDEAVAQIVERGMARNPRDRFESIEAFGEALLPFASDRVRMTHGRDFADDARPWPMPLGLGDPAVLEAVTIPHDPLMGGFATMDVAQLQRLREDGPAREGTASETQATPQVESRPSFSAFSEAATSKGQRARLVLFGGAVMALLMLVLGLSFGLPAPNPPAQDASREPALGPAAAPVSASSEPAFAASSASAGIRPDVALNEAEADAGVEAAGAQEPVVPESPAERVRPVRPARKAPKSKSAEAPASVTPPMDIQLTR